MGKWRFKVYDREMKQVLAEHTASGDTEDEARIKVRDHFNKRIQIPFGTRLDIPKTTNVDLGSCEPNAQGDFEIFVTMPNGDVVILIPEGKEFLRMQHGVSYGLNFITDGHYT